MGSSIRRATASVLDPGQQWTRRKAQLMLVAVTAVALALIVGCAWSLAGLLGAGAGSHAAPGTDEPVRTPEDQLAARPLPTAAVDDAEPGQLTTDTTGTMDIPAPSRVGPVGVPTGFAHTAVGALAQLVAIDQAAVEPGSVAAAQSVIRAWAVRGGPTPSTWTGVRAVATLLSQAGLPADGSGDLQITLRASMGLIKGAVADDFVVPCIDFTVSIQAGTTTQRVATADCERIAWVDDHWMIGAGPEPAPAPSLWPGTQASFDAGYRWLAVQP